MSWPIALLLAVLQGLTEFLPVSSSGHLVLMQNALQRLSGEPLPQVLAFDVMLHLGTLMAVVIFFRRDIRLLTISLLGGRPTTDAIGATASGPSPMDGRRDIALMLLALLPTAVIGLALRGTVNTMLDSPVIVSGLIGVTGVVLLTTRHALVSTVGTAGPTWKAALAIGAAQGLAVLPGLSRSGLTIAAGLLLGMSPMAAFRWSFLLSIPVVAGAALLELGTSGTDATALGWPAFVAVGVAAVVALGALKILAWTLVKVHFDRFAWYCFAVAATGAVVFAVWTP